MERKDCTVLITSCYAYRDVLYAFEVFFEKHWPDCPFPLVLNVDKEIPDLKLHYDRIVISEHEANLVRMRDIAFDTPYVIMIQDDHFLFDDVDTDAILEAISLAKKYSCGNLRLIQDPRTAVPFENETGLMEYLPGQAYRISARGGLWETAYLKRFIDAFDDFWGMERNGQELANSIDQKVLCTKKRILPIMDAVHKGYYEEFAYMMLEANGIEASREVMPNRMKVKEYLKGAILDINPDLITKLQAKLNIGYKKKYNY